jgi:hypothetical protein
MKPVKSNITQTSEACTPVSSNCVIWQGPDIPCLSLCSGDSVTEVVYKLGTLFCEIADSAFDIDLTCLLTEGDVAPTTRDEFYQLVVTKLCLALSANGIVTPETEVYDLPECLQYTDSDGNTITTLPLTEYVEHIAQAICDIYLVIGDLDTNIKSLENRVTLLESNSSGGSVNPLINVTVQCASGPTPGASLPVQQAFYNLENKFCALSQVLGTVAQINAVIATECTGLDTQSTLMDSDVLMQELPGWVISPVTLMENLNNMWLTICDMRSKIIECCGTPVASCVLLPPTNVAVSGLTNTTATVSWSLPLTGTSETPVEYMIQAFMASGGLPSGSAVLTQYVNHPTNVINLNTAALEEGKPYVVQITALYSCGESAVAQTISELRVPAASLCIYLFEENATGSIATCRSVTYPVQNKRTVARLQNTSGAPVVNTGSAISITVDYDETNECGVASVGTSVITILNGQSQGTVTYAHIGKAECAQTSSCGNTSRSIKCVQSIGGSTVQLCANSVVAMCPST